MTGFDDREKGFENEFAHGEELKFKIKARKKKLIGLWASELMGMNEEASLNYAIDIVNFSIENQEENSVREKILNDLKEKNIDISESEYEKKAMELNAIANHQLTKKSD